MWLNISGYCGFSTWITHFTRLPVAASAAHTSPGKCWIVKRETGSKTKRRLSVMLRSEGRVTSFAAGLTQSAGWNQVIFFSLSLQRKKLLEKNPFYACYQRVAFGLYRLSFRKRQDEDGGRFVDVVKKEEVKSSRGEGRRRWKGWTEEDDSLWGEARTDRRRYFIFQRFFLTVSQQSSGTGNVLGSMQNFKNSSWVSKKRSHLTTAGSLLCCVALCRTGDENNSSCRILRCFSSLNNDFFFFSWNFQKKTVEVYLMWSQPVSLSKCNLPILYQVPLEKYVRYTAC